MDGLRKVRRFRLLTLWVRFPTKVMVWEVNRLASALGLRSTNKNKSLTWKKNNN
jgi:hypothetical protein